MSNISINTLSKSIASFSINDREIECQSAIKIQKCFRGYLLRRNRLPLIMYSIQAYLIKQSFRFANQNDDGRINSSLDEKPIIELLIQKFNKRIRLPVHRYWYDILAYDYLYEWIPINIKTTKTKTSDNTGNFAMCLYAYTNEILDIQENKSYNNGTMSKRLIQKLKNLEYNLNNKKDYYFLVLNKDNTKDIIINSLKGLTKLTPNINNLPFQICWNNNRCFRYKNIKTNVEMLKDCIKKPKSSWREEFLRDFRNLP